MLQNNYGEQNRREYYKAFWVDNFTFTNNCKLTIKINFKTKYNIKTQKYNIVFY